jgi:hypothetical protein
MEQTPVIAALALPALMRFTTQLSGVPVQETDPAATRAVLVKVPISPKTNPEIAAAAIRVTATKMTVARTGEIPFLLVLPPRISMRPILLVRY